MTMLSAYAGIAVKFGVNWNKPQAAIRSSF
jgi:hypothetical protein